MMTAMRAFLTCPGPLIPVPDSHSISIVHGPTSFAYTDTVLKERRRKRLSQPHQDTPLTPMRLTDLPDLPPITSDDVAGR